MADLDKDFATSGTIFIGSFYIVPLEQNKYVTLEPGAHVLLTCRAGEEHCCIMQFIDELGEALDVLGPGYNVRCRASIRSDVYILPGMPYAARLDGAIIAEGSVMEILRQGL